MDCSPPGSFVLRYLLKFARTHVYIKLGMPSNHLILCHLLLLLPSIFPNIRIFSNKSALSIRWPKYWGFSFSISPSNEHSGLIFLRTDWSDLLAPRDSQESSPTPQFKSITSSVLSSFIVQLSHPYMTTGKTICAHKSTRVQRTCLTFLKSNKQQSSLIG